MILPNLAKPVVRGASAANIKAAGGVAPQGCSVLEWAECAGVVAACVAAPNVATCVGGIASQCVKCVT